MQKQNLPLLFLHIYDKNLIFQLKQPNQAMITQYFQSENNHMGISVTIEMKYKKLKVIRKKILKKNKYK